MTANKEEPLILDDCKTLLKKETTDAVNKQCRKESLPNAVPVNVKDAEQTKETSSDICETETKTEGAANTAHCAGRDCLVVGDGISNNEPTSNDDVVDENPSKEHLAKELKRKTFLILIIINIAAFLASFSYWNQKGILPYLTRKIGVDPKTYGYMESTFAIYQMLGSPLFGRCGDVFGTRIVMIVSEIAASICYGSLALANSVPLLFLTRVPAFFMHNLQGSYMIISDVTLPKDRANMLGKLGVSHGIGMVAGSFVGGVVTDTFNEKVTTIVAACGNIVCAVIIFIFIPNNTKEIRRQLDYIDETTNQTLEGTTSSTNQNSTSTTKASVLSLAQLYTVLKNDLIKYLLFIKALSVFPYSMLYSMFTMAMMDFYHLKPFQNGLMLAYVGILGCIIQGFLIGLFTKYFSHPDLVKYSVYLKTLAFLLLVVADHILVFCTLLIPLTIGGLTSHIVLLASVTQVVHIDDTGTALGLMLALHGLVRSIAPTLAGLVFVKIGWPFFGIIGYIVHLFLAGFITLNEKTGY